MVDYSHAGNFYPKSVEWANIPGCTGFNASDQGQIINVRTGQLLNQRRARNGAIQVHIGKSTRMVHDLVARAFYGHPLCRGYRVKHRNGNSAENHLDNLMWAGRSKAKTDPKSYHWEVAGATLPSKLEAEYLRIRYDREFFAEMMQTTTTNERT